MEPTIPPKHRSNILLAILILIFGILVGLLIDKAIPYFTSKPTPTSTPTPAQNPMVDWKTYTNPRGLFTFKYPDSYELDTGSQYLNRNITFRYNSTSIQECKGDCPIINSKEKITLGGKPATKITGYIGSVGGNIPQSYITYEVAFGTQYFIFSIQALPFIMTKDEITTYDPYSNSIQQIKSEDVTIFNNILSTFKFTDQTIDTSTWKTYTSSCGFSVKYPEGWNAQKFFVQDSANACAFLTAPDYTQGADIRSGFSITLTRVQVGSINTIDDYIKSIESLQQPMQLVKNKMSKIYGSFAGTQFDYDTFESTTTFVFLQNNYFWIINWPTTFQYTGQYRGNLDQILSTFKFIQ